jgi:hypothetical protein
MPVRFWRIANLTLSVSWSRELSWKSNLDWDSSFGIDAGPAAYTIHVRPSWPPHWQELGAQARVFSSAGVWAAFRCRTGLGFVSPAPGSGELQRLLIWSPQHGQAELWLGPGLSPGLSIQGRAAFDPLGILTLPFFSDLFARHQGVLVHAAALEADGRAWVFAGPSGSGKSHWTRQWQERGLAVLDEDRVVLRQLDGQVWAFGTPWHPEPRLCSPHGAPVGRIFFLRRAESDAVQEIRPAAAATQLIRSTQLPIYDPQGTQAVLDVAGQVAVQARSFLLGRVTGNGLFDRLTML